MYSIRRFPLVQNKAGAGIIVERARAVPRVGHPRNLLEAATELRLLIVGGSGHVSGTLARAAVAQGHDVWTVTRGLRALPEGVRPILVDREEPERFAEAVREADTEWDMVVDCICYRPEAMRQDIALFGGLTDHFAFVSTDFVYDPARRRFPQPEDAEHYCVGGGGAMEYGLNKRLCERELMEADTGGMQWTVFRPCHVYGGTSLLGCLPEHGRDPRLIERLRQGEPLRLLGGGHFLQQPVLCSDLAEMILSAEGVKRAYGEVFNAAGPDIVESRRYYEIVAETLRVGLTVEEALVSEYLERRPEQAPFACHRIYDMAKARDCGLKTPATPIELGVRSHALAMASLKDG